MAAAVALAVTAAVAVAAAVVVAAAVAVAALILLKSNSVVIYTYTKKFLLCVFLYLHHKTIWN